MKKLFLAALVVIGSFTAYAQQRISTPSHEEKLNNEYCSGMFRSSEGTILDVTADASVSSYFNILDWLDSRVAGLRVYKSRNGSRLPFIRGQQAAIYVDEILVTPGYLNALPSSEVAMVKVIKSPFMGSGTAGGAIAIYTIGPETEEEE